MKDLIRKWLDIKDPVIAKPVDMVAVRKEAQEATEQALVTHLQRIAPAECIVCGKNFYAFDGGWYRNSKGQIFCSHKCIDKFASKPIPREKKAGKDEN